MVYSQINLKAFNRNINLCFNTRVTLLGGDSGVGKTLLYQILSEISSSEKYSNIRCVNSSLVRNSGVSALKYLKKYSNCLVVLDNAEEILDDAAREYIRRDIKNQYLILGRNRRGLGIADEGDGTLEVAEDKMRIRYFIYERTQREMKNVYAHIKLP